MADAEHVDFTSTAYHHEALTRVYDLNTLPQKNKFVGAVGLQHAVELANRELELSRRNALSYPAFVREYVPLRSELREIQDSTPTPADIEAAERSLIGRNPDHFQTFSQAERMAVAVGHQN